MNDQTPSIFATVRQGPKTLDALAHDATMLAGLIQGLELLAGEAAAPPPDDQTDRAGNALCALFPEVIRKARELKADLEVMARGQA